MRHAVTFVLCALTAVVAAGGVWHRVGADPVIQSTPPAAAQAVIVVDRAIVFPAPDRMAAPLSYLYERERTPVFGQTADGVWLLTQVEGVQGWILRAQVELEGDPAQIPVVTGSGVVPGIIAPTLTFTPFPTRPGGAAVTGAPPTRTPLPTRTPAPLVVFTPTMRPSATATPAASAMTPTPGSESLPLPTLAAEMPVLPGDPPPISITLPEGWNSIDIVVPYRTFDNDTVRDVPLTIYFGTLPDGSRGFIYLYWGFPNTVSLATGEYNLWADGAQILRFSLVGSDCNLGVYDQRTFPVGDQEGVGAFYQAADCPDEPDTAGWFSVMRMYDGGFAFFVAVEPPEALTTQRDFIQQVLDTVEFIPPDTP